MSFCWYEDITPHLSLAWHEERGVYVEVDSFTGAPPERRSLDRGQVLRLLKACVRALEPDADDG